MKGNIVIKYISLILFSVFLSLSLFTSCENVIQSYETESEDENTSGKKDLPELKKQNRGGLTISLVQPESTLQNAGARTLLPDIDITNLTSITLTGTKSGESTVHNLGSWTSTSALSGQLIVLEGGVWSLELSASNSSFIFSDTKNVTVTIGQSQNVSFVLSADSTGGGIDFKVNFSANAQKLEYNLYRYQSGSFTSVESESDATINTEASGRSFTYIRNSSNPIQAGTYRLVLKFYGDSTGSILLNTYSEIINVKAGFISRSSEKTINLNQMHSISYKTEAGTDLDPSEYTIKDSAGSITTLPYNYSLYSGEITLPLLEKSGYIFEGWFIADNSGTLSSSPVTAISASESGDKEYRAKFIIEMKEGSAFHTTINNWNAAERMVPSSTPPDSSVTITHYLDTGTSVPVWYDTTESCIKYYAAGYTDGTSKLYLRPDSSGMFTGSWKFKVIDLTPFDTSRVTNMSSMFNGCNMLETVYVSSAFTTAEVNTSTNMFNGCSTQLKGENGFSWSSTNAKDATYAKINTATQDGYFWSQPTSPVYFITYELNEGINASGNPASYTSSTLPITLADPTGQNSTGDSFHFEGWYTSSTFASGTQVTTISDTSRGSFTLYAKWEVPYRVKHMQQNVSGSDYTELVSDRDILYGHAGQNTMAASKTKTGFQTPSSIANEPVAADGSTVINIYYDRLTYNVTYVDGVSTENIDVPSAQTGIRFGATFTPTYTGITRTGYSFAGWSDGTTTYTSGGPSSSFTMSTSNVTLTAQWNPDTNTRYYVKHMGQNVSGTGYTLIETEEKTGTTGDPTNATAKTSYTEFNAPAASSITQSVIAANGTTEVTIQYPRKTYTVSYTHNITGETITLPSDTTSYRHGATVTVQFPATQPRTGYTLSSWKNGSNTYTSTSNTFTITSNVTLTAQWTAIPYSLTFNKNDNDDTVYPASWLGTEPTEFNITQLPYTLPTTTSSTRITRNGYTFDGWYTAATGGSRVIQITEVGNKTYYAHWSPETYNLTLEKNDTTTYPAIWTGTEPASFNTDQLPYTLPTATSTNKLTRAGYTFNGWYTATVGGTKVTSIPLNAASAADQTYYAQWTLDTYTITYNWNGGGGFVASYTAPSSFSITSSAISLPMAAKITNRTNYVFAGWYTEATDGDKVTQIPAKSTGSRTYYAHWAPANVSVTSPAAALTAISNAVDGQTLSISGGITEDELQEIATAIKEGPARLNLDISSTTGLTKIQRDCFTSCVNLTGITLPSGITEIERQAFYNTGIQSITIPASVETIGYRSFCACMSLATVTIPEGVKTLESQAFTSGVLESIELPSTITTLYGDTFAGCSNLKEVKISSSNTNYKDIDGVVFNKSGSVLMYYPSAKAGEYTVPDTVTEIGYYAFFSVRNTLTNLIITDNVIKIGRGCFRSCGMQNITFTDTTTWYKTDSQTEYNNRTGGVQIDVSYPEDNPGNFSSTSIWNSDNSYFFKID